MKTTIITILLSLIAFEYTHGQDSIIVDTIQYDHRVIFSNSHWVDASFTSIQPKEGEVLKEFENFEQKADFLNISIYNRFKILDSTVIVIKKSQDETDSIDAVLLSEAKTDKINEIQNYYNSSEVSAFFYKGNKTWLDRTTRLALEGTFNRAISEGISMITIAMPLIENTLPMTPIEVIPSNGIYLLAQIGSYADDIFNITNTLTLNIYSLNSIENIENLNYKSEYPTILTLE